MKNKHILFGICGSFCNLHHILNILHDLSKSNDITIVLSPSCLQYDTRFYRSDELIVRLQEYTKYQIITNIVDAEKIGPKNIYDIMVIAPMTASVCAKLTHGIYDHPITLAAKAMIRNQKNVVVGFASNDGLGISARNYFDLINMKHIYMIPVFQDDPIKKPRSLVSKWNLLEKTCDEAYNGLQLQPMLYGK